MSRITVVIRVKPEKPESTLKNLHFKGGKTIDITLPTGGRHEFTFDSIFDKDATQATIFNAHSHLVNEVLDGFNGSIIAYGQTGAGKTHTMTGPANDDFLERGLCMRTAGFLFERSRKINGTENNSTSIRLSVLEIYNETITDLLRNSSSISAMASCLGASGNPTQAPQAQKLSIVDTPNGIIIPGLYLLPLSSEDDAYNLLFEAYSNRVVAEHQLNRRSSRSHVIYTYYVTRTRMQAASDGTDLDPEVVNSKLHLIDLAGSERVEKTGSVGSLQKEASHINRSLTFLEQVVLALTQSKRDHIPYRQSKLTYLLKDSLGGNCHTYMVACVWPHADHGWETLSTLRFAARMKNIENCPIRNSLVSKEPGSAKLQQQVDQLKRELALRDAVAGLEPWLPDLTKSQRIRTIRAACTFAAGQVQPSPSDPSGKDATLRAIPDSSDALDITVRSLSHVRLIANTLKDLLLAACNGDADQVAATCALYLSANNISDAPPAVRSIPKKSKRHGNVEREVVREGEEEEEGQRGGEGEGEEEGQRGGEGEVKGSEEGCEDFQVTIRRDISRGGGNLRESSDGKRSCRDGMVDGDEEGNGSSSRSLSPCLPTDQNANALTFEKFCASPEGTPLHVAYEASKAALVQNKSTQRQIAAELNRLKTCIDILQQQQLLLLGAKPHDVSQSAVDTDTAVVGAAEGLNGCSSSGGEGGGGGSLDEVEAELFAIKKEYRMSSKELELCKAQVAEIQILKKIALSAILQAFQAVSM